MPDALQSSAPLLQRYRGLLLGFVLLTAAGIWWFYRAAGSGFQVQEFKAVFRQIQPAWFSLAIFLMIATYPGRAIRWAVMLRPLRPNLSLWSLIKATVIGFGAIVIFGRAGEVVRPYLIAKKEKVPISTQMAAWFVERILDMIVVVTLFGFALFEIDRTNATLSPRIAFILETGGVAICLLTALGVAIILIARQASGWFRHRILSSVEFLPPAQRDRIVQFVDAFVAGLAVTKPPRVSFLLLLYTAIEWLLILGCYYAAVRSFPAMQHLSLLECTLLMGIVSLGSLVQIPGVGGGLQAATIVTLTELFRIPIEPASGFAVILWSLSFILVVPFSLVLGLVEGLSFRQIREIEAHALDPAAEPSETPSS